MQSADPGRRPDIVVGCRDSDYCDRQQREVIYFAASRRPVGVSGYRDAAAVNGKK